VFLKYLTFFTQSPEGKLWAPEEGASTAEGEAGGSQPHEESPTSDDDDAGGPDAGRRPADDDDDDEPGVEEDFSDTPFHSHPRFKALTKRYNKMRRQVARMRPLAERVKGVDLDALQTRARVADELQSVLQRRPDLRKAYMDALSGFGEEPAARDEAADFDPQKLPFNVDDDVGKYFVQQHKTILSLQKQLKEAMGELGGVKQSNAQSARRAYEGQWRAATESAAAQLPDNVKDLFQDAMYGAYRTALAEGKQPNPQHFVNSYIKSLRARGLITAKAAQRGSDAAAQRMAENNRNLPRRPAGGGSPHGPRDGKPELVADVNRRLRKMFG
jgi:hypothetical protein